MQLVANPAHLLPAAFLRKALTGRKGERSGDLGSQLVSIHAAWPSGCIGFKAVASGLCSAGFGESTCVRLRVGKPKP